MSLKFGIEVKDMVIPQECFLPLSKSPNLCTNTLPPLIKLARLATYLAYSIGFLKGSVNRIVESNAKLEFSVFLFFQIGVQKMIYR